MHQLNISIITILVNTECDAQDGQAFTSGYACIKKVLTKDSFTDCAWNRTSPNPIDYSHDMKISFGLQKNMTECTITAVDTGCSNKATLSFYLKMGYARGNFQYGCAPPYDDDSNEEDPFWTSILVLLSIIYFVVINKYF